MRLLRLFGSPPKAEVAETDGLGGFSWAPLGLQEVNTAAKTSAQIDALFSPVPANGTVASDPTNGLLIVRQAGKWAKTAALTQIA